MNEWKGMNERMNGQNFEFINVLILIMDEKKWINLKALMIFI